MKTKLLGAFVMAVATATAACVGSEEPEEVPVYGYRDDVRSWRVVIDSAAPAGYHDAAVEAAKRWEDALREACPTTIAVERGGGAASLDLTPSTWRVDVFVGDPKGECAATTSKRNPNDPRQGASVVLEEHAFGRFVESLYWRVVAHEFGHVFGLKHDVDGTIMFEQWGSWGPEPRISDRDVDAYVQRWCAPRPTT